MHDVVYLGPGTDNALLYGGHRVVYQGLGQDTLEADGGRITYGEAGGHELVVDEYYGTTVAF